MVKLNADKRGCIADSASKNADQQGGYARRGPKNAHGHYIFSPPSK